MCLQTNVVLTINNTRFKENKASSNGGAISINDDNGKLLITSCTMDRNSAAGAWGGGRIRVFTYVNMKIQQTSFFKDTALKGGAIGIDTEELIYLSQVAILKKMKQ